MILTKQFLKGLSYALIHFSVQLCVAACLLAAGRAWAAPAGPEVVVAWSGPTEPVAAGSRIEIWLNCLNTGSFEVKRSFAPHIQARLVLGAQNLPVVLELSQVAGAGEELTRPGSFCRRAYGLTLPAEVKGSAWLELPPPAPGKLALDIQEAATLTRPGEPPAKPGADSQKAVAKSVSESDPVSFFKRHLFPHEPFYFVAGTESPNAKFQVSIKYRLFDPHSGLADQAPPVADVYLGYTQTSLWDWNKESAPFLDNSYKPELLYYHERVLQSSAGLPIHLDLQGGLLHESNGRDGEASRSMNTVYVKAYVTFGYSNSFQVTLAPRAWLYLGDLSDNPDIDDYRGHTDLVATFGWAHGLQLAATLRAGDTFEHGSLQLDLTYPLRRVPWMGLTWYLHAQYFTGYGESFLLYRERSQAWRLGISLYR